jgi:hypothetical protein
MAMGASPTSPQQQHASIPQTPSQAQYPAQYGHTQHHQSQQGEGMYNAHMMQPGGYSYAGAGGQQQLSSLAAAAGQHNSHTHWQQPQQQPQAVPGGAHYGSRR